VTMSIKMQRVYPAVSDPKQQCWAPAICGKCENELPFIPAYQKRVVNGIWHCPTHLDRAELDEYAALLARSSRGRVMHDPDPDTSTSLAREFGPWERAADGSWMRDRSKAAQQKRPRTKGAMRR